MKLTEYFNLSSFMKIVLIVFILFFLPSCYNKLQFEETTMKEDLSTQHADQQLTKKQMPEGKVAEDQVAKNEASNENAKDVLDEQKQKEEELLVVINIKYDKKRLKVYDPNKKTVNYHAILKQLKAQFKQHIKRKIVFVDTLLPDQLYEMVQEHNQIIVIDMDINKTLYFTGYLDYFSLIFPTPAPQWGHFKFVNTVQVIDKKNNINQELVFDVEADFSYLIYPIYRNSAEVKAVKSSVNKFIKELFNHQYFSTLKPKDFQEIMWDKSSYVIEEEGVRLIQRDKLSAFPISLDLRYLRGVSTIRGYYDLNGREELGAKGSGTVIEYKIQGSSYKPITKYYIAPLVGYYYQDVDIKDFGLDTSSLNNGKDGYISGNVTEYDAEGNVVELEDDDSYHSMKYRSQFSSTYLGAKAGVNLVFGNNIRLLFSPLVYASFIEARHTTITAGGNEFSDWTFPLLGALGFNFETGVFFKKLHFGLKFGYDLTYFRTFKFSEPVRFNRVITNEDNITINSRIDIDKFSVFSNRFFFDIFLVF